MRVKTFIPILAAIVMLTGLSGFLSPPCSAQSNESPYASRPFDMDGTVSRVDANRDRVTFDGDDGRTYTLDTATADITLPDGSRMGRTEDLSSGMRLHVLGQRLSSGIAEVDTVKVIQTPRADTHDPKNLPEAVPGPLYELRGTVESIDTRRGAFVLRVSTHTRTIYLADDTDLTGMTLSDPNRFPVKLGDRVTVAGRLQPDGGVLAGALSLSKTVTLPTPNKPLAGRVLFGRIVSVSNRYTSRDIKIRLTDDKEVKVKVRRGLSLRRDGRAISVHDLRTQDDVRVIGSYDGADFKAERIDVLHHDEDPDTDAPIRRGL